MLARRWQLAAIVAMIFMVLPSNMDGLHVTSTQATARVLRSYTSTALNYSVQLSYCIVFGIACCVPRRTFLVLVVLVLWQHFELRSGAAPVLHGTARR